MSGALPALLAAVPAGFAAALAWPALPSASTPPGPAVPGDATGVEPESVLVRHRLLVSLACGLVGVTFVGGIVGWGLGAALAAGAWTTITRMEPGAARADRAMAELQLPYVVQLLAMVLAAGVALPDAVRQVTAALPGPGTGALRRAGGRLAVGVAPEHVWSELAAQPGFERVGRALGRAHVSGVPVADVVRRLGVDLAREARAGAEDRARAVGVRAAVPLGLCLLPAFLLVGIVPVVAASLRAIAW